MKKIALFVSTMIVMIAGSATLFAGNITNRIPEIVPSRPISDVRQTNFTIIEDNAEYGIGEWKNCIGIAHGVTANEAKVIANSDPAITFFFYLKGGRMILGDPRYGGDFRVFHHGDAVFFSGQPQWGSAPDLADGYVKK